MNTTPALQVRRIRKRFQDVLANDHINFDLQKGEIHAVLGENGAGKSTLMNIICGLYTPDEGEIYVEGRLVSMRNPFEAIRLGIGMVHQHFMLVPSFSVADNIVLGAEITRGIFLNSQKSKNLIFKLSQDYGLRVEPDAVIENLPVGVQQRVEILKALYRQAKILILDEPTAVLTPQEVAELFNVMRRLTRQGVSIIFITHKLGEVMQIANRISVMHRGRVITTFTPSETNEKELAALMVGRQVLTKIEKNISKPGEVVLDVKRMTVLDDRQFEAVREVSFQVRAGEIFGVAGVQGNGQTELAMAISGLMKIKSGTMRLSGNKIKVINPRLLYTLGIAHIPEDRLKYGIIPQYSIADNQILCQYYQKPFAHGLQRNRKSILEHSKRLIDQFDIRVRNPLETAGALSGGNLQKVIVSRELNRKICLLIANQPTRGLDVGSTTYVHQKLIEMRNRGVAVFLISVELDEIMSLSDRIAVMYNGQIISEFYPNQMSKEQVGLIMTGTKLTERVTAL